MIQARHRVSVELSKMLIPASPKSQGATVMKKIVLAMLLVAAVTSVAQTAPAPVPQGTAPVPQGTAPVPQGVAPVPQGTAPTPATPPKPAAPQKKEIKDPAEYNAYVGAVQQTDAAAKVSGLEAFLTQYPNSVMKEDALELRLLWYPVQKHNRRTYKKKALEMSPFFGFHLATANNRFIRATPNASCRSPITWIMKYTRETFGACGTVAVVEISLRSP